MDRRLSFAVAVVGLALLAWMAISASLLFTFPFAVAAAVAWCLWLEKHPEVVVANDADVDDSPARPSDGYSRPE